MTNPESYTGIRVRHADAERFRQLGRELAADVGRDLTQSEVLAVLTACGRKHRADLASLAEPPANDATAAKQ